MGVSRVQRIIDPDRDHQIFDIDRDMLDDRRRRMAASPAVSPRIRKALASAGSDAAVLDVLDHANDLFPISWLTAGLRVARSVGRIEGHEPGTGTLVSPRLLLTNHHVFETPAIAEKGTLVMNDELDDAGVRLPGVRYPLRPDRFFLTDEKLDFTFVAVSAAASRRFGFQRMIPELGKAIEGDHVTIIQHPEAGPKEIAFRQNRVTKILETMIHYQTDTLRGSSGSPVFNDQWELIALHRRAVARTDAQGNWLDIDGRPSGLDQDRTHWISNKGTRVSRILAAVSQAIVDPTSRAFIAELRSSTLVRRRAR